MVQSIGVHKKIGNLRVDFEFSHKFNILMGDSASGKSYVLKLLSRELYGDRRKQCVLVNYMDAQYSEEHILQRINGMNVVLLDNVELYLTQKILDFISNSDIMALIAGRYFYNLYFNQSVFYRVNFNKQYLTIYETGGDLSD